MAARQFAYRPALDGLRAAAVLGVIAYHLDYGWLRGGFLGVDVFFVLSGYLITSLLLIEAEEPRRIDLPAFWLRRARRLLPALCLLLIVVGPFVAATTPAPELTLRRRDLLWTLFYGANWHFIASGQDYFAQFASASPLRHAWSLAIEEQFYLVWPLVVLATVRVAVRPRRALLGICGVGIVLSAAAAAWLFDPGNPSRSYYGTDTRMFEPLVGAALAAASGWQPPRWLDRSRAGLGIACALVLAAAFVRLDARNPAYYYGVALVLSAAVAVVIWALDGAPSSVLARVLARRPVRWIGQLSYGLYLWHWPVILAVNTPLPFLRALPRSAPLNVTRVLATFVVATLSFYLLEQPVRRGRVFWIRRSAPRFAVAAVMVIAATAVVVTHETATSSAPYIDVVECPGGETPCLRHTGTKGAPVVALVGDSIARSLDSGFEQLAEQHDWTYVLAAASGCRLTDLLTAVNGAIRPMDRHCHDTTPKRLQSLLDEWNPSTIVAIDRWIITDAVVPDGRIVPRRTPEHLAMTETALTDVARRLTSRGAHLTFIELPPTVLPASCGIASHENRPECHRPVSADVEQQAYNAILRRMPAAVPNVSTISIADDVCPGGQCSWSVNDLVLRYDGVHFSHEASRWLAPTLFRKLSSAGAFRGE
jgi:peptidoglycan/LPS O-acetylase OafA/YrhL